MKTGADVANKPKSPQKKVRSKKIKIIIKAATTLSKLACTIETDALAFQDLIVQQMDKNGTLVLDAAVCYTISANAILF